MTLRRTLTILVLGMIVLVAGLVGVISTVTLHSVLIERIDNQLPGAQSRGQVDPGADALDFLDRQTTGTVGVITVGGVVAAAGAVANDGTIVPPDREQVLALASVQPGAPPQTIHLGGELGDYRVSATELPGERRIILGLSLRDAQETVRQQVVIICVVTLLVLAVAALGVTAIIRALLRPLERVTETATRVAELPLDRGEVALIERVPEDDVRGDSEANRVGSAFNRMLDHITAALTARQHSEDRVRRFVADASHELRTPLASIRGYAELTRRVPYDLPDDVQRALGRIESEATRMTSLVEDLLLLARLDSDPKVESHRVDLTRLVVDALSDAHAAAPEHEWILDVPEKPVEVLGDEARLFQVVTNLLANARVHTPKGTKITVTLGANLDTGLAEVTVADDGPGLEQDLIGRVFERFVRGDASRSRGSGSTGLGLAIVAVVVEAHGGTVDVSSSPGDTRFRFTVPLATQEPGADE